MAHPQDVRDRLRRIYIFDGLSLEIAAKQVNVSFPTARRWKSAALSTGDDWDKIKAANMLAGGAVEDISRSILMGFIVQYQSTLEQINTTKDLSPINRVELLSSLADAYTKAISASKKILPQTSQLAVALEVLQKLGAFIQQNYPEHITAFAQVLEPFGAEIEKVYG